MQAPPHQLTYYTDQHGKKPFRDWFLSLRDRAAMQRIAARLDRVAVGNLGDHKGVGSGVMELRITHGPGYRIYYAHDGDQVVLLLIGGDKSTQERDIETAKAYWKDHQERQRCTP
jgi:putative addiction module killer protein